MIQVAPVRVPARMPASMMPRSRPLAGFSWSGAAGQVLPYLPAGGAWGQASGIAQSAGSAISAAGITTGPLAAAGAAVPLIGAGLAAVGLASNLIKCGTITSLGCTKRSDTEVTKEGVETARKVIYALLQRQIDGPTAKAQIAQIWQEMNQAWAQKQRSGYTVPNGPEGFCGNDFSAATGVPANSLAATYLCGKTGFTRQWEMTVGFPQLVDQIVASQPASAPAPSSAVSVSPATVPANGNIRAVPTTAAPAASAAPSASGGTSMTTWALLGGGVLAALLFLS